MRIAGQCGRHEAQLHERLHSDPFEEIEQLVHILPVVDRLSVLFLIDAHVIIEQSVKTNIAESAFVMGLPQLTLPVRAQALIRPSGADAEVIHPVHRPAYAHQIGGHHARGRDLARLD